MIFDIPEKSKEEKLAQLSAEQKAQLEQIELEAIARFKGQLDELEAALGMLRMGHHFGWKVLYLLHSKRTIRKYEGILEVRIRELFPETGPSSYRSLGLHAIQQLSNFWKSISGAEKIERRREISN